MTDEKWIVGVDPGLIETGLALCRDDVDEDFPTLVESATYTCPTGESDLLRVTALSSHVVSRILEWVEEYDIRRLDVCIELPVYTHNAATYTKQIRLLEEIESGVFFVLAHEVEELYLTEMYPATSKALLTSNSKADKEEMREAFERSVSQDFAGLGPHTVETIVDAYAHSLSGWIRGSASRINLTKLRVATVKEVSHVSDWRERAV